MTSLLLASNNTHKHQEVSGILALLQAPADLLRPVDLGIAFDVTETGSTFGENAMLKAQGLHWILRGKLLPGVSCIRDPQQIAEEMQLRFPEGPPSVLADDSGICVKALDNAPGIRSARFGAELDKPPRNDEERIDYLLHLMEKTDDRDAHYVCNAVLVLDDEQYVQAESTWHGEVLRERQAGDTGFGYDPIMFLPEYETSVARISQKQKDLVSHRAKAIRALVYAAGIC